MKGQGFQILNKDFPMLLDQIKILEILTLTIMGIINLTTLMRVLRMILIQETKLMILIKTLLLTILHKHTTIEGYIQISKSIYPMKSKEIIEEIATQKKGQSITREKIHKYGIPLLQSIQNPNQKVMFQRIKIQLEQICPIIITLIRTEEIMPSLG